jgi:hypothetical protein
MIRCVSSSPSLSRLLFNLLNSKVRRAAQMMAEAQKPFKSDVEETKD